MLPLRGPQLFKVAGVDTSIAASSSVGPITFRWPRDLFVTSVALIPTTGLRADFAELKLRIQDENYADIIGDGRATFTAGALGLNGTVLLDNVAALVAVRPFDLQRPVMGGDIWTITVSNTGAAPLSAELLFSVEEPRR